ncbi:hypothetical protein [Streptococcus infantarius]|uniref:hypothetical protein n=1 Tax=Streptococcus infantarius TaxID=102684 RepID=UPI003D0DB14E
MKLLHSKSIRNCTDLEEAIHQAEVERFLEMIASLPNYDCDIDVTFEDDYHKEMNYPLAYESNLHRIFEFIETQDIKNGVDTYLTDENNLAFRVFGQHYMANGKDGLLTTLITVKSFCEGRSPIDMSKVFTPPTQALEKELSV